MKLITLIGLLTILVGESSQTYTYYFPIVAHNTEQIAGYAWSPMTLEQSNLLKMSWYHHWHVNPALSETNNVQFIHHFYCVILYQTPKCQLL